MLKYFLIICLAFSSDLFAQNTACIPVVSFTVNQNDICAGNSVTFHATVVNDGSNGVFTWKKNNQQAGVNYNAYYTSGNFHDGDVVTCEYSCKTSCGVDTTVVSSPLVIHVINDITPVITISNNDPLICEGEATLFTSTASYGDAVPKYQWLVNGSPVGTNSPEYSTTTLTNGSRVECVLSISTPSCPGTIASVSSQMTIYVYPMIHPAIKITPARTQICRGESITFTATANGGTYPAFAWEINHVPTGDVSAVLTTSKLNDGDTISCRVTIDQDSRCHTTTSAPSNDVVIHVKDYTDPTFTIASPILDVCAGTPVTFTGLAQNTGDYGQYQWLVNGEAAGDNSAIFTNAEFADNDTISCVLTTNIPGCTITPVLTSNALAVTVRDVPVIAFLPPGISVMSGEPAQLNATVSGSISFIAWTPSDLLLMPQSLSSLTIPLTHDTVFYLNVVDTNGCAASKELAVKVFYKLYMPSSFTPNKDGINDVFRIPPGASITLKEFIVFDRFGHPVFRTNEITEGWNGTNHGQNLDNGTYVYLVKGIIRDKEVMLKGLVTLLR